MHTRNSRTITRMAAVLLTLAIGSNAAAARPPVRDDVFRDAKLDSHRTVSVAVLPVVAVQDNAVAERAVEAGWIDYYRESRTRWVSADLVRAHMQEASSEPGNLTSEVEERIWKDGEVGPELAGRLASLLGVHAVLSVRIDRCEFADGGRGEVAMSAVLTDADGTRLWSISGCAAHGLPPTSAEQNFTCDLGTIRNPELEWNERGHNLRTAMHQLLARWAWSLPDPLFGEESKDPRQPATPLLAGHER